MTQFKQNLLYAVSLILVLYLVGALVYHNIEGWSFLDAIYFLTVTFATVGYGDITPKTDIGKMFTIVIAWVGISTGLYLLYTISSYREHVFDERLKRIGTPVYKSIMPKFGEPINSLGGVSVARNRTAYPQMGRK